MLVALLQNKKKILNDRKTESNAYYQINDFIVTGKPIRGILGTRIYKCPKCETMRSKTTFSTMCDCGEIINFKDWSIYYIYQNIQPIKSHRQLEQEERIK